MLAAQVSAVAAPPMVSQFVGVLSPIVDEFGEVLLGTDPESDIFGITPVLGDMVQVLHATDNIIHPPNVDGTPHPNNVVLHTTRIGLGVSPTYERSGMFGAAVSPRPPAGAKIFVRVFNAPSLEETSFYGDSQLFTVSHTQNTIFLANVSCTCSPLDGSDSDGDGISNSWEKSFSSDADGDGVSNEFELAARTDQNDAESFLTVQVLAPEGETDLRVGWESAEGITYRLEVMSLKGPFQFVPVCTVLAVGPYTEVVLPGGLSNGPGCYRLWAVND